MLKFFGNGSAFADTNTCAYFIQNHDMIIIDFSQSAFPKFRNLDFSDISKIYILVTHTHGDHISGIGTLIHYAYFILKIPVTVVAPCSNVADELKELLNRIEGCIPDGYKVILPYEVNQNWFTAAIPTEHSEQHIKKCFGYALSINSSAVIYTGDTKILSPYLPYLHGNNTYLYTEISAHNSGVHLYINDFFDTLNELCQNGIKVYLMHIDDKSAIEQKIKGTALKIVDTI